MAYACTVFVFELVIYSVKKVQKQTYTMPHLRESYVDLKKNRFQETVDSYFPNIVPRPVFLQYVSIYI